MYKILQIKNIDFWWRNPALNKSQHYIMHFVHCLAGKHISIFFYQSSK